MHDCAAAAAGTVEIWQIKIICNNVHRSRLETMQASAVWHAKHRAIKPHELVEHCVLHTLTFIQCMFATWVRQQSSVY